MAKMKDSLIIKLILGVIAGLVIGLFCNESVIGVIQSIKFVLGQLINFTVPLIILGFIAPAITKMKSNASKMLGVMLLLAYTSSVGAAFFSMIAGYTLIPKLNIVSTVEGLRELPEMIFKVEIPPVFSVMSALVLALFLGLAVVWTKSENFERLLDEFNNIMLKLVYAIIIPILPFFIASTFATLAYEGGITKQLPCILKSCSYSFNRAFYLVNCSILYRWSCIRKKSIQFIKILWTSLFNSCRNYVISSYITSCIKLC